MKKYIIAILGMAFTLQLTAQKVLVIHKKDGTVIEVPVTSKISFSGKAVVNDGEYTQIEVESITETVGKQPQANISINIKGCQLQGNFTPDSYGCIYGTTPGLTIDNGTVVSGTVIPFEYYETYYFRSFVKYRGETYYSEEVSAEVLPAMEWYGIYADAEYYGQSGYVHPIDEAVNLLSPDNI